MKISLSSLAIGATAAILLCSRPAMAANETIDVSIVADRPESNGWKYDKASKTITITGASDVDYVLSGTTTENKLVVCSSLYLPVSL